MILRLADDASVSASAFLRCRKWFRSLCKSARSSLATRMLVVLSSAFFLLFPRSEMAMSETAMADKDRVVMQGQLKQLQAATSIVLMFVPEGMAFGIRLEKERLPNASCVYHIDSIHGQASDDVLRILKESIQEYQEGIRNKIEVRLGLIFKFANGLQQEFYFQDWGGRANVEGFSDKYRMLASADFPTRLRALVTHPDVVLIKDNGNGCPHS
jgi:hypothetical protein